MQPGSPGEGHRLELGRVRIVFDEESHVDLWFEKDVLWGLSANGIKQEAHRIICNIVREEESLSAETAAAESAAAAARSRSGTQEQAGSVTGGPALPTANPVRSAEGRRGGNEPPLAAARSDDSSGRTSPREPTGSRVDTAESWGASRGRRPRILIRQFPARRKSSLAECEASSCPGGSSLRPAHSVLAGRGESVPYGSGRSEGSHLVPGTEAVVAYRARLRMSGVVLHFRGKGVGRGAFLFLAVPEVQAAVAGCRSSAGGSMSSSSSSNSSDSDGDRGIRSGGSGSCDVDAAVVLEAAAAAAAAAATRRASFVEGGTELWVTDESVPLLPALSNQWAASTASQAHYAAARTADTAAGGGQNPAPESQSSTDGPPSRRKTPAGTVQGTTTGQAESGESGEDQEVKSGEEHYLLRGSKTPSSAGAGAGAGTDAAALLTLRIMPSARSPLPPLCCGVCGLSWEADGFGRRFRVYHIAVATNASLVWYLHKRFSEFLALHDALSGSGCGGGGEGIPRDRLPEPPKRTFGMLKLFPEKMERFRRDQLETYLQELLSIPEALANRAVMSFLGLVSSSSNCVEPKNDGSCGAGEEDERRGRGNAGESGPATATTVADRSDRDSSDHGGRAKGTREGVVAQEGAGERCRDDVNVTATVAEKRQRPEGKKVAAAVGVARKVEKVAALEQAARGGDVVLFRCRGLLSRLQRWVLRSEWDHVGVVVSGGPSGQLELLESSKGGVRLYPLVERVRAYHDQGFARRVAWRKLRCENPTEARARLETFARQAEGKAYGIVLPFTPIGPKEASTRGHPVEGERNVHHVDIRRTRNGALPEGTARVEEKADRSGQDVAPADVDVDGEDATLRHPAVTNEQPMPPPPPPPRPHPSYLCSQLVGAALSEMGVLRRGGRGGKAGEAGWLWVLPGAFGQGGAVERALAAGASLGDEIILDAHEPEVASAVLLGDSTVGTQC
ncbi:unnamed protein product [Scytosiphon promiscuus]